jgi:hypothetical protein
LVATGAILAAACGGGEESDSTSSGGSAGAAGSGAGGTAGSSGTGGSAGVPGTGGAPSGGTGGGTPGVVRFVAIGDAGKGNAEQKQVADGIQAKCAASGCNFVQLLGDNIYDSGVTSVDDPQWQTKFEQPYAGVSLPFWVVLGNHDNGGGGLGTESWKGDIQVAYSMKTQKWKLPARYYVHQEPGVDFFGLDTNAGMFNTHAAQKTDVASWLGISSTTWKIAFGHHPYLSNGPHGNAGSYENLPFVPGVNGAGVKDLLDGSVCGKADVYIAGHDHSKQWLSDTCSGTQLLLSGGGASTTELNNKNPTHFQSDQIGFLYVVIDGNSFTGEFYTADGTLEFQKTITK